MVLATGVRARIDAVGHVRVDTPLGGVVDGGPNGLAVLALFAAPRTLADAMALLERWPEPHPDAASAAAVIDALMEAGALVGGTPRDARFGWIDPGEHARMLDDRRRTDAFTAAVRTAVRPDDVVLDIGTGSGILAMTAALAGARHVYAIEASDIAALAGRAFALNGLRDRITLIEGWSTQVSLPEPATLLVSELIGAEPLEEDILGTTLDARRRLLAPDARLIPGRLSLQARAVSVPHVSRWASRVDRASVDAWRQRYGVDLGILWESRRRHPLGWTVEGMIAATWPVLGPAATLVDIDLAAFVSPSVDAAAEIVVERRGTIDAVLLTFEAVLADDVVLTGPPWADDTSSWDVSAWFLPDPLTVQEGARLRVEYRFGVAGEADGLECQLLSAGSPSA
jgi:Ribosomal protein L11 methyltransferase (PrmA)/Arginine methyltransferase oligomerization subdomain